MTSFTATSVIPASWRIARFDELLERVERKIVLDESREYTTVGVRWYGEGAFCRERLLGMNISRKQQWIIKEGDIVYNKLFAWKGSFAVAGRDVDGHIVSDKFPTYRANSEVVDLRWLRYYFHTVQIARQAELLSKGAAAISKLTLNPPQFWDLTIPLPRLDEQQWIVARIGELAAKIEEARDLRQRVSAKGTGSLLDATLESTAKRLDEQYKCVTLQEIVDKNRGISYGIVQTGEPWDSGVPTLRAGDLQRFRVSLDGVKRVAPDVEERYRRTRLRGNELLLRIRGGLGEVAVCPPAMIGGNVSREIAVIPLTGRIVPEFGMYILSAPSRQKGMVGSLRGTSHVGINLSDVRKLTIPVPPIDVQMETVEGLNNLRARLETVARFQYESSRDLDALMPAVLDKAFSGEL